MFFLLNCFVMASSITLGLGSDCQLDDHQLHNSSPLVLVSSVILGLELRSLAPTNFTILFSLPNYMILGLTD